MTATGARERPGSLNLEDLQFDGLGEDIEEGWEVLWICPPSVRGIEVIEVVRVKAATINNDKPGMQQHNVAGGGPV